MLLAFGRLAHLSRCSDKVSSSGAAMKMDELVARQSPNRSVIANCWSAGPPNTANGAVARKSASDVPIVRDRVSLIERSTISRSGLCRITRMFSRTRS